MKIDNLHLGYLLFFISGLTFTFVILAIEAGWDRLFIGLVLLFISGAILALIIFTKPNKSKKIQNEISEN